MKSLFIKMILLLSIMVLGSSPAMGGTGIDGVKTVLLPDEPAVVVVGESVYSTQCASCHGASLEGQPNWSTRLDNGMMPAPPHDASGHTWHHGDDLLFEITKYGPAKSIGDLEYKSMMPGFERILSDDEIVAVLSFIKNTWPANERDWQDQVNGTQTNGFKTIKKKSFLNKLLK